MTFEIINNKPFKVENFHFKSSHGLMTTLEKAQEIL